MARKRTFLLEPTPRRNDPVIIMVPQTGGPGPDAYLWVGAKNGPCFATLEGAKLRDLARHILKLQGEDKP